MDKELIEALKENDDLQKQLCLQDAVESIKWMMTGQLTMAKWDTFVETLKEHYLEGYTSVLYATQKLENKEKPMKQIILEAARKWRVDKPHHGKEIMTQVIETLSIENMEEQNKKLKNINADLKAKCEELTQGTVHNEWPRRQT